MKIIESVKEYIKGFESLRLVAYKCPGNVWTLGYGTTVLPSGERVKSGMTCSKIEAILYLEHDIVIVENQVSLVLSNVVLNQYQFSSLVSLVYNIGIGNFNKSKVKKFLLLGDYFHAAENFINHRFAWSEKKQKYVELNGLINRRKKEIEIFNTADELKKLITLIDALKAKLELLLEKKYK